ncbi:MAG: ABC transporter ATP-binding protein [Hyphomicrobiales bacterium]|nr:ABC transporter ATP-binding protein [Hyphomicrobiales bacterium]
MHFSLAAGEVGALVGPSGCGKTTLLRLIAGLDRDYAGTITLPAHGRLGMVFQEPRLLPWRSVEENVRIAAPQARDEDIAALFDTLGLAAHRGDFPGALSLGLARRVAIARALAVEPDLLLLDEPFVSLDGALAQRLLQEIATLVEARRVTTLIVTHDLDEAIGLADRIFLLSGAPARLAHEISIATPRSAMTQEAARALREEARAAMAS